MKRQQTKCRPRRRVRHRLPWLGMMPLMRQRRLDRQGKETVKGIKRRDKRQRTLGPWGLSGLVVCLLLLLTAVTNQPVSSSNNANPTAVVIDLTPSPTATTESSIATVTPTADSPFPPDRFAPNQTRATAAEIGLGHEADLTLSGSEPDWFRLYLKAGQIVRIETAVYGQTDTQLFFYGGEQLLAHNDDRSPTDVGSEIVVAAPADGWYWLQVAKATPADGRYDLTISLAAPTATPTATITPTPSPTVTASPTPSQTPITPAQGAFGPPPHSLAAPTPTATVAPTETVTATNGISLTLTYLGQIQPIDETPTTGIRLLVYYDANNDRQPGPGEGVANVSVLAVNGQGQPLARVFTNAQGEAVFNLTSDNVARIIVPFVPGWSARVRIGDAHNDITLGLPAVRLPIFFPVARSSEGAE